ncbi:hypothetical protein G2W53_015148 [Senna tora]|uniref:Putative plant transposon protein domain-containing protein n=1 Tax=Senna tora TaxID=362788 RepID=A0A835C719_9FABA|nr:hypothetical protein G2W53_015148 [Senna tora]
MASSAKFYNGLSSEIRTSIDDAAGGALMSKPVDAAYTLLETMSSNNHQWHSDRHVHARVAGVQDSDMFVSLSSQIAALTKEVKSLGRTIIDVQKGELKMRVQEEEVTFNVFKAMKLPDEPEECFRVNEIESSINSAVRERDFKSGQQVLLYNSRLKIFSGKLKSRWSGPFLVTKVTPYGAVEVKDEKTGNVFLTNGQRLKHYWGGDFERTNSAFSTIRRPPLAAVFDRRLPPSRATTHFHLANPFTVFLSLFLHFFSQFFLYSKPNSTIPDPVFSRSPPSPTATASKSHHLPPLFISRASIWTISWSMASRKRKATASSTSSGTIVERFASPDTAKRYKDIFSKAKAISERGLCLNKENNDDKEILHMVDTLEWKKFAAPPKQQGHLTIVREFYANFKDHKDNKVNVRGVEIPFSREDIIKFYNLPNLPQEECGYHALQEQEAPDYGAIAEKLGKEADTSWENSKAKRDRQPLKLFLMNLKDVVSLWQHFICAHIIPGGNTSLKIDAAEIMINQVVQRGKQWKTPSIEALLRSSVRIKDSKKLSPPHLESAPSSSAQPEADHLIRELLERQERYHQEVMAEMKYLRAQSEAIDARSKYNTTSVCVIHHNLSQLIKHSEDKAHTPEYHDLPPPPPES